ncbi:hypothetical protein [Dinghuibacter silviterrae]|uniref:Gluconate 2-dehydrogenase subunit 3-like protein n=1 Tax=Dinghuibacter silviterrae TaxID=1539049 RepID=A0A4R8DGM7_9BACT|nr:hypothetical protein [Dinghuibacter silviterrae]TDW96813.1 hypothetical protein EDB95_4649 [Dinghuibacter silviterrae]
MRKHHHIILVSSALLLGQIACQAVTPEARPEGAATSGATAAPASSATAAAPGGAPASSAVSAHSAPDETLFRQAFRHLQAAVASNDTAAIRGLLHFPLLTSPQWTNDDLRDRSADTSGGVIHATDFSRLYGSIFHRDVRRLLPKAGENSLAEIAPDTKEDYYKRLARQTDPGSHLYELYMQYSDGYFGFVFGRVGGTYKVISYYAKWPVT